MTRAADSEMEDHRNALLEIYEGGKETSPQAESRPLDVSEAGEEQDLDSAQLVEETFSALFPDTFDGVFPVRKHKVCRVRSGLMPQGHIINLG